MTIFFTLITDGLIEQNSQLPKANRLIPNHQVAPSITKQPYVPPKLRLISISRNTFNNSSGGGDGDSALASS